MLTSSKLAVYIFVDSALLRGWIALEPPKLYYFFIVVVVSPALIHFINYNPLYGYNSTTRQDGDNKKKTPSGK